MSSKQKAEWLNYLNQGILGQQELSGSAMAMLAAQNQANALGQKVFLPNNDGYEIRTYTSSGGLVGTSTLGAATGTAFTEPKPFTETKKKEKPKMLARLRDYLRRHEDVFFTLAVAILVDEFIFKGAFRKKIELIVEKLLDAAAKKVGSDKEPTALEAK